jgi:hypothetical protein
VSQNAKRLLAAGLAAISIAAVPATSLAISGSTAGAQLACGNSSGGGCAG